MSDTRVASIPFSGFYESAHDAALDSALNQMFSDDCGESLLPDAWESVDWRVAHLAYAQAYSSALADECGATWQFVKLDSPREYNFRSDEIDVSLTLDELRRMQSAIDPATFAALVGERCTSRSGFVSFYSAHLDEWGALETWESPQLTLLVECYCNLYGDAESRAWDLMDDCNGDLTRIIESAIPSDEMASMYEIADALRERAA